ncbi:MAG: MBL fold metallo-hydrolase [Promethearchaeota archaeon]
MFEYESVKITWTGHDGFRLEHEDLKLHIDPFKLAKPQPVDIVIATHQHFDHCSPEDIPKITTSETVLVGPPICEGEFKKFEAKEKISLKTGEKKAVKGVTIEAVPAYNINKFRSPGQPFHPKEEEHMGVIITMGGVRIYHAGDTDAIPEMKNIDVDVALLPVSGTYVMTANEALEAEKMIKKKLVIPMHYGGIVGSEEDAKKFKENATCKVEILPKE